MKSVWRLVVLITLVALFWRTPGAAQADEILASAAVSLSDALSELGRRYASRSKNTVKLNFGPSSALARQIEQGAPVDLFLSADLSQMERLGRNGHLEPDTRKNLLSNQLVIVVAADSRLGLMSPRDLLKDVVRRVALAEPHSVPVGVYSREYLDGEGLWNGLKDKVVPVQDARAALAAVESGNVEAGFVYKTDAAISKKVKIVYQVPINRGPRIIYAAAVVKKSKSKDAARDFLKYLQSGTGQDIFRRYGFTVLQ